MKIVLLLISTVILSIQSIGQVTEGNWLIGGNATFRKNTNFDGVSYVSKTRFLDLNSDAGYFFIDKLGTGLKFQIHLQNEKALEASATSQSSSIFGIGPFLRYYFLPYDNRINLFSEAHLMYTTTILRGATKGSFDHSQYGGSIGAVAFFNSSVGIEMLINYNQYISTHNYNNSTLLFKVGFQIHLEKKDN